MGIGRSVSPLSLCLSESLIVAFSPNVKYIVFEHTCSLAAATGLRQGVRQVQLLGRLSGRQEGVVGPRHMEAVARDGRQRRAYREQSRAIQEPCSESTVLVPLLGVQAALEANVSG